MKLHSRLLAWPPLCLLSLAISPGCSNPAARWLPAASQPAALPAPADAAAAPAPVAPGEVQRIPSGPSGATAGGFVSYARPAGTEKPSWGRSIIGTPTYGSSKPQSKKSFCGFG